MAEQFALVFKDELDRRPVRVGADTYVMEEMDSESLAKWLKINGTRFQRNDKGKVIKQDFQGFHADLIHLCLWNESVTPRVRVPISTINRWGSKTLNGLFVLARDVCGLGEDGDVEKNESNSDHPTGGGAESSKNSD